MASLDVRSKVALMSTLENLEFTPAKKAAQVIINARTGTVVIGEEIRIARAAVAHGSLTVSITEDFDVSQPNPSVRARRSSEDTRVGIGRGFSCRCLCLMQA